MNKIIITLLAFIILVSPAVASAGFEGRANMAALMTGAAVVAQQRALAAAPYGAGYGMGGFGYGGLGTGLGYGYGGYGSGLGYGSGFGYGAGSFGGYNVGSAYGGYGVGSGYGFGGYPQTSLCYCTTFPLVNRSFFPYPSEYYFGFGGYPVGGYNSSLNLDFRSNNDNRRFNTTNTFTGNMSGSDIDNRIFTGSRGIAEDPIFQGSRGGYADQAISGGSGIFNEPTFTGSRGYADPTFTGSRGYADPTFTGSRGDTGYGYPSMVGSRGFDALDEGLFSGSR